MKTCLHLFLIFFIAILLSCASGFKNYVKPEYRGMAVSDKKLAIILLDEVPGIAKDSSMENNQIPNILELLEPFKKKFIRSVSMQVVFDESRFMEKQSENLNVTTLRLGLNNKMIYNPPEEKKSVTGDKKKKPLPQIQVKLPELGKTLPFESYQPDYILFLENLRLARKIKDGDWYKIYKTIGVDFVIWDNRKGEIISFGQKTGEESQALFISSENIFDKSVSDLVYNIFVSLF